MPTKRIAVDEIRADGGTQTRAELRSDVIEEYAEAMRGGAEFPPVDVFLDGHGHYWLADGFHRYSAAAIAERDKIEANIHKGELREAIWFALSANTTNGIRLTNADKRRRVEMALADSEWREKPDRELADHVGVHVDTVNRIRHEFSDSENCIPAKRKGKDGKSYPAKKKRRRRPEPKQPDPVDDEPEGHDEQESSVNLDRVRAALAELEEACIESGIDFDKEIAAIRMKLMKLAT